jgi:rhomboid family GlyGly-CTERM serine protease
MSLRTRSPRAVAARAPLVSLGVVAAATVAFACPELLELSRAGIVRGELFRLWTGHLAHYSLYHFAVDAGTLLLLGFLYEPLVGRARWGLLLAAAAPLIGVSFLLFEPPLSVYRGLSGLDCAAFAVAVGAEARRRPLLAAGLGLVFALKIAWEQANGGFLFPTAGLGDMGLPVLSAHSAGALAGFVAALAYSTTTWACSPASRRNASADIAAPVGSTGFRTTTFIGARACSRSGRS